MARQIIQKLIDDLDGGEASETISFAVDGWNYTIDLSEKNASALRGALAPFVDAGTSVGRGSGTWRPGLGAGAQRASRADNQAIRAWAAENGYELSARGRIPTSVVDAFEAAKKAPAATPEKRARSSQATKTSAPTKATKRTTRKKAAAAV
ncbi:Lsr2 family protein [Actinoplanes sp. NPDC049681]|uniref:Lsr2 family protein n=1 Tax=Actinoplanes sp. NPDC049681 TaxID=3363905 RepID=UPI0037AB2933